MGGFHLANITLTASDGFKLGGWRADLEPKVPTLLHFGDQDHSISMADIELVKEKRPDAEIYVYHAGHGFSCDERGSYNEAAHQEALGRTLAWLAKYVG